MNTLVQPKLPPVKFMERQPGEAYRPCNGTEGEFFMAAWCERCARDKVLNGTAADCASGGTEDDWCEILGRSFRTDEPLPEWRIGADGQPCCTQFVPVGHPIPEPRCNYTKDMWE